jgi:DNA-binding MarR family transcriptional regulator/GNAT superfamily N-acetyltransferase
MRLPAVTGLDRRIAAVRRFSRFYTRRLGILHEGLLQSPFSLTEARVLYELGQRGETTATELGTELGLDAGYLSRILRGFRRRGLLQKKPAPDDRRRNLLSLTRVGEKALDELEAGSRREVGGMLSSLSGAKQKRLVDAMEMIEKTLGGKPDEQAPYLLRPPEPGDMGWIVHRHGALYAQEYGWDERFEALVAEIVARFVERLDPRRERCWIAERHGEIVGGVFLVAKSKTIAQLRLLWVEPHARGLGIGTRLVEECLHFARRVGYRKMILWTNDVLVAARRIYEKSGFRLVEERPHHSFGDDLVGQTWERRL